MEILDIIHQMEVDPVLKSQLRTVLLEDEVLGTPAQVKDSDAKLKEAWSIQRRATASAQQQVRA